MGGKYLWVPEKKEGAIRFYRRHHFRLTGDKKPETGTEGYYCKNGGSYDGMGNGPGGPFPYEPGEIESGSSAAAFLFLFSWYILSSARPISL